MAHGARVCGVATPQGHFRQAEALLSLDRPRDAAIACSLAHRLDPKAAGITRQWNACLAKAEERDRTVCWSWHHSAVAAWLS